MLCGDGSGGGGRGMSYHCIICGKPAKESRFCSRNCKVNELVRLRMEVRELSNELYPTVNEEDNK